MSDHFIKGAAHHLKDESGETYTFSISNSKYKFWCITIQNKLRYSYNIPRKEHNIAESLSV